MKDSQACKFPVQSLRDTWGCLIWRRKALGTYVELQDGLVRRHVSQWLALGPGEREIRPFIRCCKPRCACLGLPQPVLPWNARDRPSGAAAPQ
jgi:hypothetical protein